MNIRIAGKLKPWKEWEYEISGTANGEGCCACKLEQRMRELGVEI